MLKRGVETGLCVDNSLSWKDERKGVRMSCSVREDSKWNLLRSAEEGKEKVGNENVGELKQTIDRENGSGRIPNNTMFILMTT